MIDEEKLTKYNEKYAEVKNECIECGVVKANLESQQKKSKSNLRNLKKSIQEEKGAIWYKLYSELNSKQLHLKKQLCKNVLLDLLAGILLTSLGHFVVKIPLSVCVLVVSTITISRIVSNVRSYKKDVKKYSFTDVQEKDLQSTQLQELQKEYTAELARSHSLQESLDIVNQKMVNLGDIKLAIENLIICLFSNLDNMIQNKSDRENPFASWVNISYLNGEAQLEISTEMKRTRKE